MAGSIASGPKAEPNLTPILDMVFQLITFFMLVINFKAAELDLTMKLPVVGSAKPIPLGKGARVLVLNVEDIKGEVGLKVSNALYTKDGKNGTPKISTFLEGEAKTALGLANLTREDLESGEKDRELKDYIVIRADRDCPFENVDYVVTSCQVAGFRQFVLKSAPKEKTPKG